MWLAGMALSALSAHADSVAEPDTTGVDLRELEVVAPTSPQTVREGGNVSFNTSDLSGMSRNFGEVDIINQIKLLPGVATMGDYGSGVQVDGAEASQTVATIDGVPLFFPYRFGGVFSQFNTPHFKGALFERNEHSASMPSRLGGRINFSSRTSVKEGASGTVNVGIIASSATIKAGFSKKLSLVFSGRVSYLTPVYGSFLRYNATVINYDFYDLNFTLNYTPDSLNLIQLNGFWGSDRLKYSDSNYGMDTHLQWRNSMASLSWTHKGPTHMTHRIYYTGFGNRLQLTLPQMGMKAPAQIGMVGISGAVTPPAPSETVEIDAGYEFNAYRNIPLWADFYGFGDGSTGTPPETLNPIEGRLYADAEWNISSSFTLRGGVSLNFFHNRGGYHSFTADPRLTLIYRLGENRFSLHAGIYHQWLHQVGFSEIGLASDFWLAATKRIPAQRSYSFSARYERPLSELGFSLSAEVYWKRVLNQPEYNGMILDLIDSEYEAESHVYEGSGFNSGVNLGVRREIGNLTGSVSYGFGVARRRFGSGEPLLRGRTDPGHTVRVQAAYSFNLHWEAGATFLFATGRVYTPVRALYLIAGNIISVYGRQNSANLPAYHRLDISGTYKFTTGSGKTRLRHFVNLSVINAYGHRNVEGQYYKIDIDQGIYHLKRLYSAYRFIPSISYTLEF